MIIREILIKLTLFVIKQAPSSSPSKEPTKNPTRNPTRNPTKAPTRAPVQVRLINIETRLSSLILHLPNFKQSTQAPTKNPTTNPTKVCSTLKVYEFVQHFFDINLICFLNEEPNLHSNKGMNEEDFTVQFYSTSHINIVKPFLEHLKNPTTTPTKVQTEEHVIFLLNFFRT